MYFGLNVSDSFLRFSLVKDSGNKRHTNPFIKLLKYIATDSIVLDETKKANDLGSINLAILSHKYFNSLYGNSVSPWIKHTFSSLQF